MNGELVRTWVRKNRPLFRRIVEFNWLPALYLHPERKAELLDDVLWDALMQRPSGQQHLSRLVWRRLDLRLPEFFDFQPARRRFALLDTGVLSRLAQYVGAALAWPRISRAVGRDQVLQWKQQLGEDLYQFAVKRAPFLMSANSTLPQLLREGETESTATAGWRALACCCTSDPPGLVQRFQLKFPPSVEIEFDRQIAEQDRDRVVSLLKKILLAEVQPESASCFN